MKRLIALVGVLATSVAAQAPGDITLPTGHPVPLETVAEITTKKAANGDLVPLITTRDVVVDGQIAIPKGTPAKGQLSAVRAKGALGQSGKLSLRPLYLQIGNTTVRLDGATGAKSSMAAGAVVGMLVLTPGFTGRSAVIKAGTPVEGEVLREVTLPAAR